MTAFGNPVGDKMLEGGNHALGGSAPYHRGSHLRRQVHVLAVSFLHAGPARFAGQVDHRTVPDRRPLRLQFRADGFAHLLHEFRVPGRCQADRGREHRRSDGHVPVRRLLGEDDGDSQPGRVHRITLQGVVRLRGEGRIQAVLQRLPGPRVRAEHGPEHAAVLVLDEIAVFVGDGHAVGRHFLVHRPPQRAQQLSQFLIDRHPPDEIVRPLLRRAACIFIHRGFGVAGRQQSGGQGTQGEGMQFHSVIV